MTGQHGKGKGREARSKGKEELGHKASETHGLKGMAEQMVGKVQKGLGELKDVMKQKFDEMVEQKGKKST